MKGDRDKFLTLRKERYGSISFGNDDSTKIIGKGTVRIGNKNTKAKKFLLVEDMKYNLLSVFKCVTKVIKLLLIHKSVR